MENAVGRAVLARLDAKEWTVEEGVKAHPEGLFLAVERWKRDVPVGGHTIICTHPNGTQKEVCIAGIADPSIGTRVCTEYLLAQQRACRLGSSSAQPLHWERPTSSSTTSG